MSNKTDKFIAALAVYARAEYLKRDKWVLPSVCIAQAALETGWGTSKLMTKANAYFGIKANSAWRGKVYSTKTKECYDGKNYVTITDCFRAYDNLADSVADYYDLICKSDRYAKAVCNSDAKSTITAIKNGGYATAPSYINSVMTLINNYDLTKYDVRTPASKPAQTVSQTASNYTYYLVRKGDTMTSIAKAYDTTVSNLARINGISNPNVIIIGQSLKVPKKATTTPTSTYTVKAGDTLTSIARAKLGNGGRYIEIANLNGISNPNVIKVGQVLKLPK